MEAFLVYVLVSIALVGGVLAIGLILVIWRLSHQIGHLNRTTEQAVSKIETNVSGARRMVSLVGLGLPLIGAIKTGLASGSMRSQLTLVLKKLLRK